VVSTSRRDSDAILAQRIRSGDREAIGELYDGEAGIALAVAMRLLRSREAAEDVVHDAFVQVWRSIDRYDAAIGSMRSWLLTIVRNKAIDSMRRTRPTEHVDELELHSLMRSAPNPTADEALAALDRSAVRDAIATLPADQREAVILAYFGGLTYREVAERLEIPAGTAASRLRLALGKLRATLSAAGSPVPIASPALDRDDSP
jgi:RNA polymerase sigma-70 factor, ECF subfamily